MSAEAQRLEDARQWGPAARAWQAHLPSTTAEGSEAVRSCLQHVDLCRAWASAPADPPHGCSGPGVCRTVGCAYADPEPSPSVGWDGHQ